MDRSQQYVTALLDRVPKWELVDPQHQDAFDKIKETLTTTGDLRGQLKSLYKVAHFSEFALGLLWITDKVERDPTKLDTSTDEENFIFDLLKKAFEESPAGQGTEMPSTPAQPTGFELSQPEAPELSGFGEVAPTSGKEQSTAETSGFDAGLAVPSSFDGGHEIDEQGFAATLEKLLEAIQSGSEERNNLLEELTGEAERIVAQPAAADDYKAFCGYMVEFLKYITTNQLFDDIRVMNMMSNVFDPFSQWTKTEASARVGMLDQPIEMLRDFKTLFE